MPGPKGSTLTSKLVQSMPRRGSQLRGCPGPPHACAMCGNKTKVEAKESANGWEDVGEEATTGEHGGG